MIACGEKQDDLYLEKDNNLVWNFEDIFCLHVPSIIYAVGYNLQVTPKS